MTATYVEKYGYVTVTSGEPGDAGSSQTLKTDLQFAASGPVGLRFLTLSDVGW
jgi:hypothetical protein